MRFFAHDGKTTHGPSGIDELLKLPGFDGDTLVCPVGSDDTSDWKPALAYPPFRKALLEAPAPAPALAPPPAFAAAPAPVSSPMPAPVMAPPPFPPILPIDSAPQPLQPPASLPQSLPSVPAEPPKTVRKCPKCAHANTDEARFCNTCGARMDAKLEDISSPLPTQAAPAPLPLEAPEPAPVSAFDSFAQLDPMLTYPTEPAPMPKAEPPRRQLQPGKMGQLGALEETAPLASAAPDSPPPPALAPDPAPATMNVPVWKRPAVLSAFVGAALVAAGSAFFMLNKSAPMEKVAELAPSAPPPVPEEAPAMPMEPQKIDPIYKPAATVSSLPPALGTPKAKRPAAPAKRRPARAAKPKERIAASQDGGETFIESRAPEPKQKAKTPARRAAKAAQKKASPGNRDTLLEALLADATQPGEEALAEPGAAAAKPLAKAPPVIGQRAAASQSQFSLPGLHRPVSASDRAPSGAPLAEDTPELSAPARAAPPLGIENEPVKSSDADQLALVQVHEQFDFCSQLLAQGAYGDHFDTCLCRNAREASPYRGRRGYYVKTRTKEADAGHLETIAKILSSKIDAGIAKVTARWSNGPDDKGRESTQSWKLEDGLWCQAP